MATTNPQPRISADPAIMVGKPCIKGTGITVEIILRYLAEGVDMSELQEAFPRITSDDIRATVDYAADTMASYRNIAAEQIWPGSSRTCA